MPGLNAVFCCPNLEIRDTLIRAIAATEGPTPQFRGDSVSAKRAHYPRAETKAIINTPDPMMYQALGPHRVCIAVEVIDRVSAAETARDIFAGAGYHARVVLDAQPEYPLGLLAFVVVEELDGIVLMYWPRPEDVTAEIAATLPKQEPWE